MTTSIGSASTATRRDIDDVNPPDEPGTSKARGGGTAAGRFFAADAVGRAATRQIDAALADFVANAATAKSPEPSNDDVLFVGVNPASVDRETKALRNAGVGCKRVDATAGDLVDGHDLATPEGRRSFVATLGLSANVGAEVEQVLAATSSSERGAVAQIARAWGPGQSGGVIPSRLVISGHSGSGAEIWSEAGFLDLRNVRALASAMPRAAAQIEDLHFSACSSRINARDAEGWKSSFPNLKTVWAYNGSAPSPASTHLVAWAGATRGRTDSLTLTPALREQCVAVWSAARGYDSAGVTTERLRERAQESLARLPGYLDGSRRIADPHEDIAQADYAALRDLSTRPGVPSGEAATAKRAADQLLRARYYEAGVRGAFGRVHGDAVKRGYEAVGLVAPDFGRLSRAEAMRALDHFERRLAATSPPPRAATAAAASARGLASLDASVIEERWCSQ